MQNVLKVNIARLNTSLFLVMWVSFMATSLLQADSASENDAAVLKSVERKIIKEPKYKSSPRYALMVLGVKGSGTVWMVEDGDTLYVDRNGNGDLTDDGPPIQHSNIRELKPGGKGVGSWDCEYLLNEILPGDGTKHTKFKLSRWNYEEKEDSYGLNLTVNGRPMYAGWFGTFWSASKESAPLIHLGGALHPELLIHQDFVIGRKESDPRELAINFINSGSGKGAESRLSIESLAGAVPVVQIDWPVPAGAPVIQTTNRLTHRCCYWCYYETTFKIPEGVVAGTATVKVTLDGFAKLDFSTCELKVPVRDQPAIKRVKQK